MHTTHEPMEMPAVFPAPAEKPDTEAQEIASMEMAYRVILWVFSLMTFAVAVGAILGATIVFAILHFTAR